MKPIVAITIGDPNGIGPEVTLKSLQHPLVRRRCIPVLVGPPEVFRYYSRRLRLPLRLAVCDSVGSLAHAARNAGRVIPLLHRGTAPAFRVQPGLLSAEAGLIAADAIREAVGLVKRGHASAIVTGPVSKHALHLAGVNFPGQTEMVCALSGGKQVVMMLVSEDLRIGLVTIHLPLRRVSRTLTSPLLRRRLLIVHQALRIDWGIRNPRIAVLALNPHAGEEGDLGTEERDIIEPALAALRGRARRFEGPFPADGFFGHYTPGSYDAVVAMYHDQGLIPLKMRSGGRAVNISVGLPIVRTSPDHGTAFPLAGKGIASAQSMVEAILLAVHVARRRALRGHDAPGKHSHRAKDET